jgi:hypothetical protein
MGVGTLTSLDEYLRTSYRPDCDFIEGEVLDRHVGKRRHSYAQADFAHHDVGNSDTAGASRKADCRRTNQLHLTTLPLH